MKTEDEKQSELRQQAEKRLRVRHKDPSQLSPDQLPALIHELEVHQIELEMQNDELQQSHLELELAKDRFADLFDFAPVGYLILDIKGRIVRANLTIAELFDMPRSQLHGGLFSQFVPKEEHANTLYLHLQQVFSTQRQQSCEVEAVLGNGTNISAKLDSAIQPNIEGISPQCLTLVSDITELKQADVVNRQAREAAEKANQAKSRFLAAASHDLRQPLQAMTTINDVLKMKLVDEGTIELVDSQSECLNNMNDLFNALLNLSQLETGSITPIIIGFRVGELLRRIETIYRPLAKRKGLCLRTAWSSATILSDPTLLGQILDNLVSNAIRYTEVGKILVGCRHHGSMLRIEVWDTGIGIPGDDHEQIFDEFYQLDNPARDRSKGLGLGLAIATQSANLLGAKIELESRDNGSLFSIEAPLVFSENVDKHASTRIKNQDNPGLAKSLLVVEDNDIVLYALIHLLESYGYKVTGAANGQEALEFLRSGTRPFELIITDYRLPKGLTGLELIKIVRRSLNLSIPAIIVTGDLEVAKMQEIMALDLKVLVKPVPAEILSRHIQEMLA